MYMRMHWDDIVFHGIAERELEEKIWSECSGEFKVAENHKYLPRSYHNNLFKADTFECKSWSSARLNMPSDKMLH